jgi:hypothetical protein
MNPLRQSLPLNVALLIAAILIGGFGVLLVLNIRQETSDRIHKNRETARLLANSISASVENGMIDGRARHDPSAGSGSENTIERPASPGDLST